LAQNLLQDFQQIQCQLWIAGRPVGHAVPERDFD
jgi:hypothetical protein